MLTFKGQCQNLTSASRQSHVRSSDEPCRSCCISVDASTREKHIGTIPSALSLFYQKLEAKRIWTLWPLTTQRRGDWVKTAYGLSKVVEYKSWNACSYSYFRNDGNMNIFTLPYNDEITKKDLSSGHGNQNSKKHVFRHWCLYQLLEVSYWSLKNCSHGTITIFFFRQGTWPDLMTWPEMNVARTRWCHFWTKKKLCDMEQSDISLHFNITIF